MKIRSIALIALFSLPIEAQTELLQQQVRQLFIAAKHGDRATVQHLLAGGVPINARNQIGATALHVAVSNGHRHLVQLLLAHNANINALIEGYQLSALHLATALNNLDMLSLLLKHSNELVNAPDTKNNTPLHMAAYLENRHAATLLLKAGANKHIQNDEKATYENIIKMLKNIKRKSRFNAVLKQLGVGYVVAILGSLVSPRIYTKFKTRGRRGVPKLILNGLKTQGLG